MFKKWFDERSSLDRDLSVEDLVLRWEKKHKENKEYTKFQRPWLGPFIVTKNIGPSTVQLQTMEGVVDTYPVNVFMLKKYFVWKGWFNPVYMFGVLFSFYFLNVFLTLVAFGNISTLGNNEQSVFLSTQYSQPKQTCQFLSFLTRIRIYYIWMITIFAEFYINSLSSRLIYSTCLTLMVIVVEETVHPI